MEIEPPGIYPEDPSAHPDAQAALRRIEEALDDGRPEDALELIDAAEGSVDPLDLAYLEGDARYAVGDFPGAEDCFHEVLESDPRCSNSRCWLAHCLYRQCRFTDAEIHARQAMAAEDAAPDAFALWGALLERRGQWEEADQWYLKAHGMDPERFLLPVRLTRQEFDREVELASERLPDDFRHHLEQVPILVQDVPSDALLESGGEVDDPELLGLFCGPSLADGQGHGTGAEPDAAYIYLFQRNLERHARDREELEEQIAITLYHELGHYLGFDEEGLEELGLQ